MSGSVDPRFWQGKRVFLTGHTGFKGSWLSFWLQELGANVKGLALEAPAGATLFREGDVESGMESDIGDIRDLETVVDSMTSFDPEVLIHMAAQPLVRLSYRQPVETYATNVMGTVHVLEAARQCDNLRAIVNVTTDKCYENQEWVWAYRENEPMGGHDPYSSSKGCVELATAAYRSSFFCTPGSASLGSARAGNVIGGGDFAEDRLIPDILRAFEAGKPAIIRNPYSIRPWQHVLEPLRGYLLLAERLWNGDDKYSEAWNFGPGDDDARTVEWVVARMAENWGGGASSEQDVGSQLHEAKNLKLDISKARDRLFWQPAWPLEYALDQIVAWHLAWRNGESARKLCEEQIKLYTTAVDQRTARQ